MSPFLYRIFRRGRFEKPAGQPPEILKKFLKNSGKTLDGADNVFYILQNVKVIVGCGAFRQ
jgi:hypothetical protein